MCTLYCEPHLPRRPNSSCSHIIKPWKHYFIARTLYFSFILSSFLFFYVSIAKKPEDNKSSGFSERLIATINIRNIYEIASYIKDNFHGKPYIWLAGFFRLWFPFFFLLFWKLTKLFNFVVLLIFSMVKVAWGMPAP